MPVKITAVDGKYARLVMCSGVHTKQPSDIVMISRENRPQSKITKSNRKSNAHLLSFVKIANTVTVCKNLPFNTKLCVIFSKTTAPLIRFLTTPALVSKNADTAQKITSHGMTATLGLIDAQMSALAGNHIDVVVKILSENIVLLLRQGTAKGKYFQRKVGILLAVVRLNVQKGI